MDRALEKGKSSFHAFQAAGMKARDQPSRLLKGWIKAIPLLVDEVIAGTKTGWKEEVKWDKRSIFSPLLLSISRVHQRSTYVAFFLFLDLHACGRYFLLGLRLTNTSSRRSF